MMYTSCTDENIELSLSETVRRSCATFTFPNTLFAQNGHIEQVQAVIMPDSRRVTLDRSHTEVALFDGNSECL